MPYIPYGYQPGYYGQAMPDQLAQLRQNAYQQPMMGQAAQQTQGTPSIIWVQGEEGAKAYMVAAGNSVLLMDSENSAFYIKSTDASAVPFSGLMEVLDRHMSAIKIAYPKEYELVMRKISRLTEP